MALISSVTISHADASWVAQFSGQDHAGTFVALWHRNGTKIHASAVPQAIRNSVAKLVSEFNSSNFHR